MALERAEEQGGSASEQGSSYEIEPDTLEELARAKSNLSIAETLSPIRELMFVAVVCMAQFMTQAALGQCISILHVIGDNFGLTNPGELIWLIAAYSLTVGTFILISGRLGDLFGWKTMLIIGFAWFSLWSLVAGLSVHSNHVLFNFARVYVFIT